MTADVFMLMEADDPTEPMPTIGIFGTVEDAKAACPAGTEWKQTATYEWAGRHIITQPNASTRDLYLVRQVPFGERFEL